MKFDRSARIHDVLTTPAAREVVDRLLPGLLDHPMVQQMRGTTLLRIAEHHPAVLGDPDVAERLWTELAELDVRTARRADGPHVGPQGDYEGEEIVRGSAIVTVPTSARRWSMAEVVLNGPSHGNPFLDVEFTATFTQNGSETTVGGFYDDEGRWVLRYLPEEVGACRFVTSSTARSLDGIRGEFAVANEAAGAHGPVRVDGFHFAHADGTRHTPLGTTAYAWLHQPVEVREATLRTLQGSPFTKLRMTIFPKSYDYNSNDPELYPFPVDSEQGIDSTRFDPAFFRRLESAVAQLDELGIEADLILFHPYDRWGFADLGADADDRYVRYLVRRLWAFPNVWWSIANEYDLMWQKALDDWERLAGLVVENDPAGHLLSIHNATTFYDNSRSWVTHASVQRVDRYRTAENVGEWRQRWRKPVIVDECGYEGNLQYGWGNLAGKELVRRFWEGAVRGGYVGHGETYYRADEQIWWAKGGELAGEAPARIAFLRDVIAAAPGAALEPVSAGGTDAPAAGVEGQYYLVYFGHTQPLFCTLMPAPGRYHVEVLDTWNMTIERLPEPYEGGRIDLPGREYIAVRLVVAADVF